MRNSLKWAVAAASVLVLSLLSVQQTGAAWRDTASISDATITAGKLDLSVGKGTTGFKAYPFTALAGVKMMPGTFVQKPLVVFNSGNVGMKYELTGVSQTEAAVVMDMSITKVANELACTDTGTQTGESLYSGAMSSAAFGLRQVPVEGKEVLCVRATMKPSPPGKETTATMNFDAVVYR